jgi:hypothetical protein
MITIRGFRAIDDPEVCDKFLFGHRKVLESINVKEVTSSKATWIENPDVYVIVVESLEDKRILGGARVHKAGAHEPLPVESATDYMDPTVKQWIGHYAANGAGEICGLWNSREVAGLGIGAVFLTRAAVACSTFLGIHHLFALCAPYTVDMAKFVGYEVAYNVGNKGTFYYPKLDLVATAMILKDVDNLSLANEEERSKILELRSQPNLTRLEVFRKKTIELHFELDFKNLTLR